MLYAGMCSFIVTVNCIHNCSIVFTNVYIRNHYSECVEK